MIKSIVLVEGHDHGVVIVGVIEEVNFAEEEHCTVDSVAVVVEFHVDFVVEHICVSVEATIVGEDRFHWRLLNLSVQSEVVGR